MSDKVELTLLLDFPSCNNYNQRLAMTTTVDDLVTLNVKEVLILAEKLNTLLFKLKGVAATS